MTKIPPPRLTLRRSCSLLFLASLASSCGALPTEAPELVESAGSSVESAADDPKVPPSFFKRALMRTLTEAVRAKLLLELENKEFRGSELFKARVKDKRVISPERVVGPKFARHKIPAVTVDVDMELPAARVNFVLRAKEPRSTLAVEILSLEPVIVANDAGKDPAAAPESHRTLRVICVARTRAVATASYDDVVHVRVDAEGTLEARLEGEIALSPQGQFELARVTSLTGQASNFSTQGALNLVKDDIERFINKGLDAKEGHWRDALNRGLDAALKRSEALQRELGRLARYAPTH